MTKFFDSSTLTTVGAAGLPSATVSGFTGGLSQSLSAAQKAAALLSERSGQRDSLLQALNILFADQAKLDPSVLETYLKEINGGLIATNDSTAFLVRNVLLAVVSGVSNVLQIPGDSATVVTQTGKGLLETQIPSDKSQEASKKAFIFNEEDKYSSASASSVAEFVGEKSGKLMDAIYYDINIHGNSHAKMHARTGLTGASASISLTAALPSGTAMLIDMIGQIFREGSAIKNFSANESASVGEKNVYLASAGVVNATRNSESHASKKESGKLEKAVSHMKPGADLLSGHGVTSPLTTALLRLIVVSIAGATAKVVNKTALALAEGRIQKALKQATGQGCFGGVDRINSLHTNLSTLSNVMRLCAENLGGASAVRTAVLSSEVISSRALSVLLTNVGKLADALLGQPVVSNQVERAPLSRRIDSTLESARPNKRAQTEASIKEVLDRIERENGHHIVPGLNQDIASQLDTSAQVGIASLITTHSLLINPVSIAKKASEKASRINEAHKNEALMATLPGMTQALNNIQAFTRNMIEALDNEVKRGNSEREGSLLSTHQSAASTTAILYRAVSTIALLSDEMLSICRSLTLIDQNRLKAASEKVSQVASKEESAQSLDQIAWDSHLGQEYSATHAISALRLTLSHTGLALMGIALDLHRVLEGNMNTEQQNLAMHTLQRSLLNSSASAARYLAEGVLLAGGAISASLVSLNGSVNSVDRRVHTTDAHLHPEQTHESERLTHGITPSTEAIGFSTDLVAGTITNVLKVLAQGSIIGMDTVLKLIKLLEIISLHRDSHIALRLESNDSANPNGLLINTLGEPSIGSTAGTSAIFINILAALQTVDRCSNTDSTLSAQHKLQDRIDSFIEAIAVLKDEEERCDNKLGLKEFYKIIIRLLAPGAQEGYYTSLIRRLDFGGISLSSYHTKFGAHSEEPVPDLRFVRQFGNEDDAQGLLRRFIDRAKDQPSLLKSLHDALPEAQRSVKAQTVYGHVFEELYQHYKQIKMKDIAKHGSSRRKIPDGAEFEIDSGLVQEPMEEDPDANQSNMNLSF